MSKKDLYIPIGIFLGLILIGLSVSLAGGSNFLKFINLPSFFIVMGGIFASLVVAFKIDDIKTSFRTLLDLYNKKSIDIKEFVSFFVDTYDKPKQGDKVLDYETSEIKDSFIRQAAELYIEGHKPEMIEKILKIEMKKRKEKNTKSYNVISKMGELAPAWGMIGTIIGLTLMLQELKDPTSLGPTVAIALMTTLYGIIFAHLFCIPIANKIKSHHEEELNKQHLIIDTLLSMRLKEHPIILKEKLIDYLSDDALILIKKMILREEHSDSVRNRLDEFLKDEADELVEMIASKKEVDKVEGE